MELFTLWCGFIGAWLLFAGPIYQAAIELREEDIWDGRLRGLQSKIVPPPDVSPWWWLLPPIKIYLERRRGNAYRTAYFAVLSEEDAKAMVSYMNKATGWLFVAGGGFLIALKETYELTEGLEAAHWVFWITALTLAILSVLNTAFQIARSQRILTSKSS